MTDKEMVKNKEVHLDWRGLLYSRYVSTGQARSNKQSRPVLEPKDFIYINRVLKKFMPKDRNARILDLGCGHGPLLRCIKEWGYNNIQGIDVSEEQVELAHHYGISEVQLGSIFDLSAIPSKSVDLVFLMDVLEHLQRQELFDLLSDIREKMTNDGLMVIHVPNACGVFGNAIRFADLTHELSFTPSSLSQCMGACGFCNLKFFEDKPIPHGLLSFARRILWDLFTIPFRILYAAEVGVFPAALSQNMLATASPKIE